MIKVKNIEPIVVKGKLIIITSKEPIKPDGRLIRKHSGSVCIANRAIAGNLYFDSPQFEEARNRSVYLLPYVISGNEQIEVGDLAYGPDGHFFKVIEIKEGFGIIRSENSTFVYDACRKVLALPEHFSTEHLQMIIQGNLKMDDEVLLECETMINVMLINDEKLQQVDNEWYEIKMTFNRFDYHNRLCITLHKNLKR